MKKKLTVLLALVLLVSLLGGCAAKSMDLAPNAPDSYYDRMEESMDMIVDMDMPMTPSAPKPEAPMEPGASADDKGEFKDETTSNSLSGTSTEGYSEKIIYSGYVYLQTTDFDSAIASLESTVESFGGFVQDSSVQGNARTKEDGTTVIQDRWAHYMVRIPTKAFNEFMGRTEGIGNVTNSSRSAQNVTSQYTDYEARLASLEIQEERLLDMLKKSGDLNSLITLEARLSEVRYEIESIERNLRDLDQRIAYSTINLELREVAKYTPTASVKRTFGEKLGDAFSDGWNNFLDGVEDFTLFLAESLLTLVFLAAIIVVIVIWIRRSVRKRRAKKAARMAPPAPPTAE
jgi:hypothetical protein